MNYNLHYTLRVLLLSLIAIALGVFLFKSNYLFTPLILSGLLVASAIELWYFVRTGNEKLNRLLFSLKHKDPSLSSGRSWRGAHFEQLEATLKSMLDELKENKQREETEGEWLRLIVMTIPIPCGVIEGQEVWLNVDAQELFQLDEVIAHRRFQKQFSQVSWEDASPLVEQNIAWKNQEYSLRRHRIKAESSYELFFFQAVQKHNEDQEVDAWLRLIRIMTHEIMNSITSISSLSETAAERLKDHPDQDLKDALQAIRNRTASLTQFVQDYRRMSHVPAPNKTWFDLGQLVKDTLAEFKLDASVDLKMDLEEGVNVRADELQSKHVLSNLILNAVQAMESTSEKVLYLALKKEDSITILTVKDSGTGVESSDAKDIFIPFFSTKEEGSGIGLSLARQMMRNQGGSLSFEDNPTGGAIFKMHFR